MAFGDPFSPGVWVIFFVFVIVAGLLMMLIEGYTDNESLPQHPWGLLMDCMCVLIPVRVRISRDSHTIMTHASRARALRLTSDLMTR